MPDYDAIAVTLAAWDIPYLMAVESAEPLDLSPADLITLLAQSDNPRINEVIIPFFLHYPEHHQHIPHVAEQLATHHAATLKYYYTAAVYLQRFCWTTLSLYLGTFPALIDYYGQSEFKLAAPNEYFGELGLHQLSEQLHKKTGYEWFNLFQSVLSLSLTMFRLQVENELSYA